MEATAGCSLCKKRRLMHKTRTFPKAIQATKNETKARYTQKSVRLVPPASVRISANNWEINNTKNIARELQKSGKKVRSDDCESDLLFLLDSDMGTITTQLF